MMHPLSFLRVNQTLIAVMLPALLLTTACGANQAESNAASPSNPTQASQPSCEADLVALPPGYQAATLVDDLEHGDRFNCFAGTWFTYDDQAAGGSSQVTPKAFSAFQPLGEGAIAESRRSAKITGQVTTTYPDGYLGMGTDLSPSAATALNLEEYDAIEFWARGDGGTYRFKIHSAATPDYDDYGYNFVASESWNRYIIPLTDLTQEGWGNPVDRDTALQQALKLQWQTIGQPHDSIEVAVDHIRFLKAN